MRVEFDEMDIYSDNEDLRDEFEDDNVSGKDAGFMLAWREADARAEEPVDED